MWSVAVILGNTVLEQVHCICSSELCHSESSSCVLVGSGRERVSDHGWPVTVWLALIFMSCVLSPIEPQIWVGPAVLYHKMVEVVHPRLGVRKTNGHELAAWVDSLDHWMPSSAVVLMPLLSSDPQVLVCTFGSNHRWWWRLIYVYY